MFSKFSADKSVSGKTVAKSSVKRAITNDILTLYPSVCADKLEAVLPKKEILNVIKW